MRYLLIAIILLVAFLIYRILLKRRENHRISESLKQFMIPKSKFQPSEHLDEPIAFGYKNLWFAVKTNQKEKIAELLGLVVLGRANWKDGVDQAYDNRIFITPEVEGWTLICGEGLMGLVEDEGADVSILNKLSAAYGEVQYFCTHRVTEYHVWASSRDGVLVRYYSYLGEQGCNLRIEGSPSEVEQGFQLINTFSDDAKADDYFEREDIVVPDEGLVMSVAKAWSVSPIELPGYKGVKREFGIVCVAK